MQFGSGDAQVKGWDDVDVEQALEHLTEIEITQHVIHESAVYETQFLERITIALTFVILIEGIKFGYKISPYFVLRSKDM